MPQNAAAPAFPPTRPTGAASDPITSTRRGPRAIDAHLRVRFRNGDPDAVRAVYSAYGRLVYAVAHQILRERGLSEEATQQTFLKAWRAAGSIDAGRELGPWLAAIARRAAIDIYRREVHRAARPLDAVSADDPALVAPAVTLEEAYEVWEVRRAVSLLPDDEREVVRAQHFEGLTHSAIAARLGVPVGTVKSRSFRAHKRLAAVLGHLRPSAPLFIDAARTAPARHTYQETNRRQNRTGRRMTNHREGQP